LKALITQNYANGVGAFTADAAEIILERFRRLIVVVSRMPRAARFFTFGE
jgi:hypothetical protein